MTSFKFNLGPELNDDEKLKFLLKYYNIEHVKVDEEDKPMLIMALNQSDVVSVNVDNEGSLVIGYEGEDWAQPEESYEQRTI